MVHHPKGAKAQKKIQNIALHKKMQKDKEIKKKERKQMARGSR
jgi:hypothetical protein